MKDLSAIATPDAGPWAERTRFEPPADDPRGSYQRDRDRILHCASFRKLQHKTQVLVVHEGDYFRTRLTHTLEVTQIGRTLARWLRLQEDLVEAICLGHDLGHAAFGHAGEQELQYLLAQYGMKWNANAHSLTLVENLEVQYPEGRGLNLTWATREGLSRHSTKYDVPDDTGEYSKYSQPSLEAQVANLADVIAYSTHDVEDALFAGLLEVGDFGKLGVDIWDRSWQKASGEVGADSLAGSSAGFDRKQLRITRARRHLIDLLNRDVHSEALERANQREVTTLAKARDIEEPLVVFSAEVACQIEALLNFMMKAVYKAPLVARQNYRARHIVRRLFEALISDPSLLPLGVQALINDGSPPPLEVARFLAGLTDRGAADLYSELFEPTGRALGHRIP